MCVPFDKFVRMLVFWYVKTIIMENNAENAVSNACQIGKKNWVLDHMGHEGE